MQEHLMQKNVAAEIAIELCASVAKALIGRHRGTFESLTKLARVSLQSSLERILTPSTSTDLLRDISDARHLSKSYVITFIGVNGVGKSTNLSKICFWLLQNQLRVLIVACDTFRAGAVEQLRIHVNNLKMAVQKTHGTDSSRVGAVELFERGYGKDAAAIAKEAIYHANLHRFDVVLIDTAGRMQDNEPLMRSLAKLINTNTPDKILFVGEALVGNEALDQLTKFNRALGNYSGVSKPRQIDGIILSKFDTVDDKVGAALSMTFVTGRPILFVGTGQTYTDLKKLNLKKVVKLLLD